MNQKPVNITKASHKKVRLINEKNYQRKIDEKSLQLYGLDEKLIDQTSHFDENNVRDL